MGVVIHYRSKNPILSKDGKINLLGSGSSSYHSVNQGQNLNFTLNVGGGMFASFSANTLTRFGDLKMGCAKNPFNQKGYFREQPFYTDRINRKDTLVKNENRLVQKYGGYDCQNKFLDAPLHIVLKQMKLYFFISICYIVLEMD